MHPTPLTNNGVCLYCLTPIYDDQSWAWVRDDIDAIPCEAHIACGHAAIRAGTSVELIPQPSLDDQRSVQDAWDDLMRSWGAEQ